MINFEDGVLVTPAKVNQDGTITPAQYSGKTPLSAYNLNRMQKLTECITGKSISTTTIEGACKIKKVHGDLQQETSTQGKNICPTDISYWESGHYATNGVKENSPARIRLKKLLKVEPNTTYYLSTNSSDYPFVVRSYDSTGKFLASVGAVQTNTTITTASDVKYLSIALYKSGANMNDQTFENYKTYFENGTLKPFICLDSVEDKTYEEFSPNSPSPDYPSEIKVVGDNLNLFDEIFRQGSASSTTDTKNIFNSNSLLLKAGTYTFSTNMPSSIKYAIFGSTQIFPTTNAMSYNSTFISKQVFTFTLTEELYFGLMIANVDGTVINPSMVEKYYFKLEQSTVATGYTSYGNGGIDYKASNSNMFDANKGDFSYKGLNFTYNSNKSISIKGTTTGNVNVTLSISNFPIAKSGKTYTKWVKVDGTINPNGTNVVLTGRNSAGVNYYNDTGLVSNKTSKFTKMANEDMLMNNINLYVSNSGAEFDCALYVMFYEGENEKEYEPHKSQTTAIELPNSEFLAKIGDAQDYIDNKGVLHKYIGKKVLTGTETWTKNGSTNVYYCNNNVLSDIKLQVGSGTLPFFICSHFKADTVDHTWNQQVDNTITVFPDGTVNPRICMKQCNTVDEFKTWLSEQYANGTPVEIYYVLATPYEVNFKYNNILPQYAEMTYISCSAISEIETTTSPAIASVNETFDKIQNDNDLETTIMIGDSYGEGANATTNWCDILKRLLNLSDKEYYKFAKGGAGFKAVAPNGQNFIKLLQDNINSITNKTAVKNIIVCGGYNDITETYETITEKIEEFCDYCKYNFPNAKIYCGMIGNNSLIDNVNEYTYSDIRQKLNDTITPAYQTINKYGGIYLNGVETCLKDYSFIGSDNYHPNDAGQNSIAQLIYQCLKIGNGYIYTNIDNAQLYEAGNGYITNYQVKIYHSGGNTKISIPNIHHTFSAPVSPTDLIDFRLFGIDSKLLRNQYMVNIPIMCLVNDTLHLQGKLYLSMDNKIVLRVNKDKPEQINKIIIYPEEYIIPTKYC